MPLTNGFTLRLHDGALGVTVTLEKVGETGSGIVAVCVRGQYRQATPILDLPLPDPAPRGAEWIAAYGRWAG
jgi:hypothetical protein